MAEENKNEKKSPAQIARTIREGLVPLCLEEGHPLFHSNAEDSDHHSHAITVDSSVHIKVLNSGEITLNGQPQENAEATLKAAKEQIADRKKMTSQRAPGF